MCRLASLHAPHIIVDLKEFWKKTYTNLLQESTKILVVTRLDFPAITNANRVLEHLEHLGIERGRVSLVVNRTGQPKELSPVDVACALKMKISHDIPDDRKTMNGCTNCGNPAVCEAPQSKCARAIAQIADEIDNHVAAESAMATKSSLMERAAPFIGKLMQATNVRLEALVPKPIL
jgi:Flp pilus assembly CpaE family ATPase